jgi:hypothetical protein
LKQRLIRLWPLKIAGVAAIGAMSLVLAPALASGAEANPANTVFISAKGGKLHFEFPKTIVAGEELTILNTTNPKQVGPHTFSLVQKSFVPKTRKQIARCFTPHHICKAIAQWHGVKGRGGVKIDPAEAGAEGWDTMGSLTEKGDSWFTGVKPHASFTQKVTAAPGTTIHFMCAIHPWMHGQIEVLP